MTKEELEKEVEEKSVEYADSIESISIHSDVLHYSWEQITNAYEKGALDFAEPREKQLTKAKELLKHWANSYGGIDITLCKQTQQFLNEVKK